MALLFLESWDSYGGDTTQANRVWSLPITLTTAHAKTGTYAYGGGAGQFNRRTIAPASNTVYFDFWVYWTGAATAFGGLIVGLELSGFVQCALNADTSHRLYVTRFSNPGTTLQTSVACLNTNAWNNIKARLTVDNSGSWTVKCNGVQVLNGTGDTQDAGSNSITSVALCNAGTTTYALDSLAVWDSTGSAPNAFLAESHIVTGFLPSTGNGANTGLTPSVGTDHGILVDEAIANDDTDYNGGGAGVKDTYIFNTAALEDYGISGVQVSMCVRATNAGTNTIAGVARVGSTDYDGATQAITTSYAYYHQPWGVRPSDSTSWLQTDLSQFGMKSVASAVANRLTRIYLEVLSTGIAIGGEEDVPVATIAGVLTRVQRRTFSITEVTNGRNTMTCDVVSEDASVRPAVDAEVVIYINRVRIFAGTIDKTTETGVGQSLIPITTRLSVNDFNSLADRRYLQATFPLGSLKSMLEAIQVYLDPYGVTLDPAQVTGPTLDDVTYDYRQITEILNNLVVLAKAASGDDYVWEIDYDKVLRMYVTGAVAAPFDVVDGDRNAIGDIAVDQTARTKYANRIILRAGTASIVEKYETFTGTGTTVDFALTYTPGPETDGYEPFRGYVTNAGVNEPLGVTAPPYWLFDTGTGFLSRSSAPANGNLIEVYYNVQFPITVIAEDLAEQAANGIIERMVEARDVFDIVVAQAMADAELAIGLERPNQVRYRTRRTGLKPGMTQTITAARRNVNDTYLVTEIRSSDSRDKDGTLIREVTATQGTTLKATWREYYKRISGSGGASAPVAS